MSISALRPARVEPERAADVTIVVIEGSGLLCCDDIVHQLAARFVAHIPKGARRRMQAHEAGLSYLTVHRRRSLDIAATPPSGASET